MQYNPALDGVRAIAVAAVVAFHCDRSLFPGGFIGVDVFFVLSGYLITTLLWQERQSTGTIALGYFYWRRALRLWPPLLLMLMAYVAFAPSVFPETPAARDALLAGLYLSDYTRAFWGVPTVLSHTWSLSVEEHFYLVWPVVVILLARFAGRGSFPFLLAAFIVATAWRMIDFAWGLDFWRTYYRFDTRMSGLILGGAIAMMPWRPGRRSAEALGFAGLLALAIAAWSLQWKTATPLLLGGVVVDLAAGCLILAMASPANTVINRALALRSLVYVGTISYSIYLWHYPMVRALRNADDPLGLAQSILVVAASVAIAGLSCTFIEKPIRRWRMRPAVQPALPV